MDTAPVSPPRLSPIRVLCVDDLPDVTAALRLLISCDPGMVCVGCLSSASDLVREVEATEPDVLILDATIPGQDPIAAMKELAHRCPETRTIVYSGHADSAFIDRVINAGAWRCVSKQEDPAALLLAVREVAGRPSSSR